MVLFKNLLKDTSLGLIYGSLAFAFLNVVAPDLNLSLKTMYVAGVVYASFSTARHLMPPLAILMFIPIIFG